MQRIKDSLTRSFSEGFRLDLLKLIPPLKWLVKKRWFQFYVILPNLLIFILFLIAGLWGTPVGNRNILIIFVWILWWFLLISVMVPFFSRIWCTMCPFPFFGEWLQRKSLTGCKTTSEETNTDKKFKYRVGNVEYFGLGKHWPKRLRNMWIQNIGFLFLCTFSAFFLTRPVVSVVVLGSLFLIATIISFFFRQRAFCLYICPVSGFLGLYSMFSATELRVKDRELCRKHKEKECVRGSEEGHGCPWFLYPGTLDRNNYCGLCMECVKACPEDNITVNLRPFGSDATIKNYGEAWKGFIMLAIAVAYSFIYLGRWGALKNWANFTESGQRAHFFGYTAGLWVLALGIIPAIYGLSVWLGKKFARARELPLKDIFLALSYSLVPLGLFIWIAFSFPLMFVNGSYIPMVISDPMGWGWDIFGTAGLKWKPILPEWMPYLQVFLITTGFVFALKAGYQNAKRVYGAGNKSLLGFMPVSLLLGLIVVLFLYLYSG